MTLGVIGTKLGMTQIYDETGLCIPVTVVAVEKAVVTQVKTKETDGYEAIQVGVVSAKEKHLTKAQIGHFKKNNLENFRHLQEFRVEDASKYEVGQAISLEEVLANVQKLTLQDVQSVKVSKVLLKDTTSLEDQWATVLKTTELLVQSALVQLQAVL